MQKTGLDDWLWPPLKRTAQKKISNIFFFSTQNIFGFVLFLFLGGVHDCRCVCVKEFQKREEHRCEGLWEEVLHKAFGEL